MLVRIQLAILLAVMLIGVTAWFLAPANFIVDDSYFYLVIARNIAETGRHTFSGIMPTNGTQPLWLYLLSANAVLISWIDSSLLNNPIWSVPLSSVLVIGAAWHLWKAAGSLNISRLAFAALPILYVLSRPVLDSEGALLLACLAWFVHLLAQDFTGEARSPIIIGLVAAATILARLDSVFLVGTLLLLWGWGHRNIRRAAMAAGVIAIIVVPYLASNVIFFGGPVPISGWMKSSFPRITLKGLQANGLSTTFMGYSLLFGVIPIVLSLVTVVFSKRSTIRNLTASFGFGTLLHFIYIALFTQFATDWYWYYVPNTVLFALCLASWTRTPRSRTSTTGVVVALCAAVSAYIIFVRLPTPGAAEPQKLMLDVVERENVHNTSILVANWPGYLAFYSDNHVISADMLTADLRFYNEMCNSQDAIAYIRERARNIGFPVRYIMLDNSTPWLTLNGDGTIIFNDPHSNVRRPIGRLHPDLSPLDQNAAYGFYVWQIEP